jgi:kumamolisin
MEVTVRVRRKAPLPAAALDGRVSPAKRSYLAHSQLEAVHGADPADLAKVEAFARQAGLTVVESTASRRSLVLTGTVAAFSKAFNVVLERWQHPGGTYRGRTGPVRVPSELASIVTGVFGLDDRPFARPHFRRLTKDAGSSAFKGFTPNQIGALYNFPTGVDGRGQVIGIIELGGGFRPVDLTAYFQEIGVSAPAVTAVSVDHGRNAPSNAHSADAEVMLDIEVAASIAPGAQIVVYFAAGKTDRDFLDAITQAVHDSANNPSVISVSWGGPESSATASFQAEFDQVLQSAAALGITVTIASGDSGAADEGPNEWDNLTHADFPASSPFALACGATNIQVAGGQITAESVWNQHAADIQDDSFGASGGGISLFFPVPSYQSEVNLPKDVSTGKSGRGVPDVSGDGDPASGYVVRVDGQEFPIGGTSAVAPLWAGLIALINQKLNQRVGFINPLLYANPAALRNVTAGDNKVGNQQIGYNAGPGWNACTGLGSPDGLKLLAVLGGS